MSEDFKTIISSRSLNAKEGGVSNLKAVLVANRERGDLGRMGVGGWQWL